MEHGGVDCDMFSISEINPDVLAQHKHEALSQMKLGKNLVKT